VGSRRKSRELALQILFELDLNHGDVGETIDQFWKHFEYPEDLRDFSERLVKGVEAHREEIDRLIELYSKNWSLNRIDLVDLNILRVAIFELANCPDIPLKVAINEAIELSKKFGTEKSPPFINGILDKISQELKGERSGENEQSPCSAS
jgi:transcription antitermination protein NusB